MNALDIRTDSPGSCSLTVSFTKKRFRQTFVTSKALCTSPIFGLPLHIREELMDAERRILERSGERSTRFYHLLNDVACLGDTFSLFPHQFKVASNPLFWEVVSVHIIAAFKEAYGFEEVFMCEEDMAFI